MKAIITETKIVVSQTINGREESVMFFDFEETRGYSYIHNWLLNNYLDELSEKGWLDRY